MSPASSQTTRVSVGHGLLICVGDPRKGGSRLSFLLLASSLPGLGRRWGPVWGQGGAPRSGARTNDLDADSGCHRILAVGQTRRKALQFKPCRASACTEGSHRGQEGACQRPALTGSTDKGPAT
jgi:hypothetical protein